MAPLRVAWVSEVLAVAALATGFAFWANGWRRRRWLGSAVSALLVRVAAVLLARAGFALAAGPDIVGDVGDAALAIASFFVAGIFNLVQIRVVRGRVLERLVEQSHRDPLTGVANRRGLMVALDAVQRRSLRTGDRYGLLRVDVDDFKRLDDSQGHAAGDTALHQVAQLLAATVRARGTVGRFGGEEFCVLLPPATRPVPAGWPNACVPRWPAMAR